jgi:transposase
MSNDANTPRSSAPAAAAAAVPTVVVAVNRPPSDNGIVLEVRRVPVNELPGSGSRPEVAAAGVCGRPEAATCGGAAASKLPGDTAVLQRMVEELVAALEASRCENAALWQQIDALSRRLYGPRPERVNPNQPLLFPEPTPDAAAVSEAAASGVEAPPPQDEPAPPPRKKKGHGRRRLEDLLPRLPVQRVEHVLTEAECLCPHCGRLRRKVGEQTTQQLDYRPAQMIRVEHAQFTYSCPHCPEHIITAAKTPQPIDGGLPGPGLLAAIATHKYDEHQPLYRQELSLWRDGLFLARSTTCAWMAATAAVLQPLLARMKHYLLQSRVIQTDSTRVDVLVEGQAEAQTGQLWPYLGDGAHPYVVVDFSVDHTNVHPVDFLADYRGYVQADAHAGYDALFIQDEKSTKVEVGCWAHAERRFEENRDSDPPTACQALGFIKALFDIEDRARAANLSEAEVLALRQRESVPILNQFKEWLDPALAWVLPKSPMGEALRYVHNQWLALKRYTEAGFLEMTNNASERVNKIVAIGRGNWLFVGSAKGGETAAALFSITGTCRRLQMDCFAYLHDLLTHLPRLTRARTPSPEQLDSWLPDRWLARHPEARYPAERCRQASKDREGRRRRRKEKDRGRAPPRAGGSGP